MKRRDAVIALVSSIVVVAAEFGLDVPSWAYQLMSVLQHLN